MSFLKQLHACFPFWPVVHVFFRLSYMPDYYLLLLGMYFLTCYTYLILVLELFACISRFFVHTKFLFLTSAHAFSNALPDNGDITSRRMFRPLQAFMGGMAALRNSQFIYIFVIL